MGNPYQDLNPPDHTDIKGQGLGSPAYHFSEVFHVPISGRDKLSAMFTFQTGGAVILRIDDAANPEFWAEVTLTPKLVDYLAERSFFRRREEPEIPAKKEGA